MGVLAIGASRVPPVYQASPLSPSREAFVPSITANDSTKQVVRSQLYWRPSAGHREWHFRVSRAFDFPLLDMELHANSPVAGKPAHPSRAERGLHCGLTPVRAPRVLEAPQRAPFHQVPGHALKLLSSKNLPLNCTRGTTQRVPCAVTVTST